jgi:hypothetical protein
MFDNGTLKPTPCRMKLSKTYLPIERAIFVVRS